MTPHKLKVFISVYNSNTWVTAKEIVTDSLALRTVNKHLCALFSEGFIDKIESFGGYRYQAKYNADFEQIKAWAKIYDVPCDIHKKPACHC